MNLTPIYERVLRAHRNQYTGAAITEAFAVGKIARAQMRVRGSFGVPCCGGWIFGRLGKHGVEVGR